LCTIFFPGTGKTLLAKAVATESGFSFFAISASNVTSKFVGEGEKLMKGLFTVARMKQPAVIFMDEIDSLMGSRKESEHEASRRLKTEFLVQLDGATTSAEDRLLVMAATNLPWEIDEAVLRRLVKRIYVPLPDTEARRGLIMHMLSKDRAAGRSGPLSADGLDRVVHATQGYSCSDLTAVVKEAAMGPIREMSSAQLATVRVEDLRAVAERDFLESVQTIRPSVSPDSLQEYQSWAEQFGVTR
jgi:SpoVK/Ycf46/Vps4 family AAA+-type ATPase